MNHKFHSSSAAKLLRSVLFLAAATAAMAGAASADFIKVTNLVTNDPTAYPSQVTDPNLVNSWGMSYGPSTPLWVSDNGAGVATLYHIDPATNMTSKVGLTVSIPGDGSATGQAFNSGAGAGAFHGDPFLFVSEDGTISGWRPTLGSTAETLQMGSTTNVYKGTTVVTMGGHTYLFAANFATGAVDVLKGDAGAPNLAGHFADPTLPAGYAPFNVQMLGNHIFVTFAKQQAGSIDEAHGAGLGLVSEFNLDGTFVKRVASNGPLNAPWGLAIAPSAFGAMAGDLLVGNFGDGHINVFNMNTDKLLGELMGKNGSPLTIDGLWGLIPGNGGAGGSPNDIYFSSGPNDENNGLFGSLSFVPEPASVTLLLAGLLALGWRRRKTASA